MKIQKDISIGHFSWLNAKIYSKGGGENRSIILP